jgi:hypothetical protein
VEQSDSQVILDEIVAPAVMTDASEVHSSEPIAGDLLLQLMRHCGGEVQHTGWQARAT